MWVQLNDVGLHAYKVPSIPPPPLLLLVGIGLSTFGTDQCPAWLGRASQPWAMRQLVLQETLSHEGHTDHKDKGDKGNLGEVK